jgi:hypothetical protein
MVLLSGGRSWLVIRDQASRGSGVATYVERIFSVASDTLAEVMSYVSDGHQSGDTFSPTRDFSSRVLSCEVADDVVTVRVQYRVEYSTEVSLFNRKQEVTFVKNRHSKSLHVDEHRSECSSRELSAVYDIDSLTNEDFVKYNYRELAQIATGVDRIKRKWLSDFLNECEWTQERRRLAALLN